jgi:hypothetical protein
LLPEAAQLAAPLALNPAALNPALLVLPAIDRQQHSPQSKVTVPLMLLLLRPSTAVEQVLRAPSGIRSSLLSMLLLLLALTQAALLLTPQLLLLPQLLLQDLLLLLLQVVQLPAQVTV